MVTMRGIRKRATSLVGILALSGCASIGPMNMDLDPRVISSRAELKMVKDGMVVTSKACSTGQSAKDLAQKAYDEAFNMARKEGYQGAYIIPTRQYMSEEKGVPCANVESNIHKQ